MHVTDFMIIRGSVSVIQLLKKLTTCLWMKRFEMKLLWKFQHTLFIEFMSKGLNVELNLQNMKYKMIFYAVYCIPFRQRRPEKAIGVHIQLTGALLCLHLSFLLCSHWVLLLMVDEEDWVCKGLGLWLHWSLLATFTWTALEGFHIYLLLVRVFNIYVRRYTLKISLVGWGE